MIALISLAIIVLIIGIVIIWQLYDELDIVSEIVSGVFILGVAIFIDFIILSPILVLDKSSGMTIGEITSVDKNFFGSTAIYLKTSETTQEKYCAEDEDIIEFAKNYIGKRVRIGYVERVGIYKLSQCDQAPIEHIEVWE